MLWLAQEFGKENCEIVNSTHTVGTDDRNTEAIFLSECKKDQLVFLPSTAEQLWFTRICMHGSIVWTGTYTGAGISAVTLNKVEWQAYCSSIVTIWYDMNEYHRIRYDTALLASSHRSLYFSATVASICICFLPSFSSYSGTLWFFKSSNIRENSIICADVCW